MSFKIWEGIYNSFSECPECGAGHTGSMWLERSRIRVEALRATATQEKPFPFNPADYYLPLLISGMPGGFARILDFGGGLGFTYVPVIANCTNRSIEYHIVDSSSICDEGRDLFKNDGRIFFHKELPLFTERMDIIHLGSSLQYIDDWRGLLGTLTRYQPRHLLLTDLMAGQIPTYASIQNYYESKIATWFFNIDDVLKVFSDLDYSLQLKSFYNNTYLGVRQEIPQDNFPEKYRLKKSCNLLFTRK